MVVHVYPYSFLYVSALCSHLHNATCELHPTEESNQELLSLIQDWFNNLLQDGSTCCHQTGSSRNAPASLFLCPSYGTPQSVCEMGHGATCDSTAIETNLRTCNSEVKDTYTKMGNTGSHEFESICSKCQRCNLLKVTETLNTIRSNDEMLENKYLNSTNNLHGDNQTYTDPGESCIPQHNCTVSLPGDCKACVTNGYSDTLPTHHTVSLPNNSTNSLTNDCIASSSIDCTTGCPSKCLTGLQNDCTANCSNICESLTAHIGDSEVRQNDCPVSLPNNCTTSFLNDGMSSCSNICDSLTVLNTGSEVKQNDCPVSVPNNCTPCLPNDCTTCCSNVCDSLILNAGSELKQNTPICYCCEDLKSPHNNGIWMCSVGGKRKEVHTQRQGDSRPSTPQPRVCMVGLHCCGDLTPTMLKCFNDLDCIRSLCCVSCCYHRMKYDGKCLQCHNMDDHFPADRGGWAVGGGATVKERNFFSLTVHLFYFLPFLQRKTSLILSICLPD